MVPQKDEHGPNLGMKGQVRGRREEGSGGRRVQTQEAPLPLPDQQAGGQHGVQGVRDLHLAPRPAECRLLRQQCACAQQNEFCHEMVLMSAAEKPTEVSSLPGPTAAGTRHTSIQSVRGEGSQERINLIQM